MKLILVKIICLLFVGLILGFLVLKFKILAPILSFAAIIGVIMLLNTDWALLILLLGWAIFHNVPNAFEILAIVYFASFLLRTLPNKQNTFYFLKKDFAIAIFFIIGIFSTLRVQKDFSDILSYSFFFQIQFICFSVFLYFVVNTHISSLEMIKKIIMTIVVIGVYGAIEGLVYYKLNPLNLEFGELTTAQSWGRSDYIELLLTSLPFCYVLILHQHFLTKKVLLIIGFVLICVAMITTLQKTLFVIFVCFAFYGLYRHAAEISKHFLKYILGYSLSFFLLVLGFWKHIYFVSSTTYNAIFSPHLDIYTSTWKGRLAMWRAGLEAFRDNPFFGHGLLMTPSAIVSYTPPDISQYLGFHNAYLTFLVETGILGFSFYIILILSTLKEIRFCKVKFKKNGNLEMYDFMRAIQVAFIAQLIYGIPSPSEYFILFWLLIALSSAIHRIVLREEKK